MTDLFNNMDIKIDKASQVNNGLSPDDNSVGQVILKSKEDMWIMANTLDTLGVIPAGDNVFQVSTYKDYPVSMGIGIYANDELQKMVTIQRDEDSQLYFLIDDNGDKIRYPIFNTNKRKGSLNTVGLFYDKGTYNAVINGVEFRLSTEFVIFPDVPVFFVEFDTILKAAVIGPLYKLDKEIQKRVTQRPSYFIKDINE